MLTRKARCDDKVHIAVAVDVSWSKVQTTRMGLQLERGPINTIAEFQIDGVLRRQHGSVIRNRNREVTATVSVEIGAGRASAGQNCARQLAERIFSLTARRRGNSGQKQQHRQNRRCYEPFHQLIPEPNFGMTGQMVLNTVRITKTTASAQVGRISEPACRKPARNR
ncbi:MAG TPA: hypothetical protein VE621_23155 [Bryobacteraceae bacterium]|nr:hypothetical protein [Bryobacteraceae bacterium]